MTKTVLLTCGFANRLRTIVGFTYVALETNQDIIFHWRTDDRACNGSFSELFFPLVFKYISNSGFTVSKKIEIIDCIKNPTTKYHFIGQDIIANIIKKEAPHLIPLKAIKEIEDIFYSFFVPKPYIYRRVNSFLGSHDKIGAAMHIRRSDHSDLAKKNNKFTEDQEFIDFVKAHSGKIIFLATDERAVQDKFKKIADRVNTKIVVYKQIEPSCELRQTSLQDAFIDILIASTAEYFQGSGYSSYSYLIEIFYRIMKKAKTTSCEVALDHNVCVANKKLN